MIRPPTPPSPPKATAACYLDVFCFDRAKHTDVRGQTLSNRAVPRLAVRGRKIKNRLIDFSDRCFKVTAKRRF